MELLICFICVRYLLLHVKYIISVYLWDIAEINFINTSNQINKVFIIITNINMFLN